VGKQKKPYDSTDTARGLCLQRGEKREETGDLSKRSKKLARSSREKRADGGSEKRARA